MCLGILLFDCREDFSVVLAANRDEFLDRPAAGPERSEGDPWIVAPRDLRAGGTWFGVNGAGLVVLLTNREGTNDPGRRSRGLLTLDLLRCRSLDEARRAVGAAGGDAVNPFQLFALSREAGFHARGGGRPVECADLDPGLHTLTNLHGLDEFYPEGLSTCDEPRLGDAPFEDLRVELRRVLSGHDGSRHAPCKHFPGRGTRSSFLLALPQGGGPPIFEYADGPPCRTPYDDRASLFPAAAP